MRSTCDVALVVHSCYDCVSVLRGANIVCCSFRIACERSLLLSQLWEGVLSQANTHVSHSQWVWQGAEYSLSVLLTPLEEEEQHVRSYSTFTSWSEHRKYSGFDSPANVLTRLALFPTHMVYLYCVLLYKRVWYVFRKDWKCGLK